MEKDTSADEISHTFNFMNGCSNDCVHCPSKEMAIRFKRKTSDTWKEEVPLSLENRSFKKEDGVITIPYSHDITPTNIGTAIQVMEKLLTSGNNLLVLTKPHFTCVKHIADTFESCKDRVAFRFIIGSADSQALKLWEPGAPDFQERLESLEYAFRKGYATSISCDPLLDDNFSSLYEKVSPFVTESIWVGKMKMASKRTKANTAGTFPKENVAKLLETQTDEKILDLFRRYRGNPRVLWRESIQKVARGHGLM